MAHADGTKSGGRRKGSLNKATKDLKEAARLHCEAAVARLAHLMFHAQSEQAQIAACKELLDRGYGKPAQAIIGDEDEAPIKTVMEIVWGGTKGSRPDTPIEDSIR